jgi:hypothetical protein
MAITEQNCHQLYTRLEEILGREEATVLMEHLPPVGWADVATRRDLEILETRIEALDARFEARLERGLRELQRNLMFGFLAAQTAFVGVVLAVG